MNRTNIVSILSEYKTVDGIYGVYLDAARGFFLNGQEIVRTQRDSITQLKVTQEYLDNCKSYYGIGNPNDVDSYILHVCTQKEFKERNEKGGRNHTTLGNHCIIQIFQYWEDYYRGKLALELSIDKYNLKSDIYGDLRILRNSIIHHQSKALPEIKKCKFINWFEEGDIISLGEKQVEKVVYLVKIEIDKLLNIYSR